MRPEVEVDATAHGIRFLHPRERTAFVVEAALDSADCEHLASRSDFAEASVGTVATSHYDTELRTAEASVLIPGRLKDARHWNISQTLLRLAAFLPSSALFDPDAPLTDRSLEAGQVVRYAAGGHYGWHTDKYLGTTCGFLPSSDCRAFTAIVYLNTVPASAGGATALKFDDGRVVRVQPKAGTALFFLSSMMHEGEALLEGEKLILNQWVRDRPLALPLYEAASVVAVLERASGVSPHRIFAAVERRARPLTPHSHVVAGVSIVLAEACALVLLVLAAVGCCWALGRCCNRPRPNPGHVSRRLLGAIKKSKTV
jgi:hypothetical protein